ncbi:hypothetical protein BJV82DRAFT_597103 [Fennellomyces sp. T-0311]|nr:hypothetical protein BJV82DRAFT_597103 [Fennellomyces sp. T-0311]
MLSAAERAKKRRDEEEAEYQAARERARKKAEALAALTESKPKPVKSEEKTPTDDSKSNKDQQGSLSNDSDETAKISQNKEPSPVISIEKPSPEDVEPSAPIKPQETKEKVTIPEKVATIRDASPSSKPSSKSRKDADKKLDYDEDEDNKQWDSFVEGIRESKTVERKVSNDGNASAWNAYATRLQESSESRMNAAIDKYAAERNLDPSLFDDMRQRDREPLRLPRHRETGRRSNNNRDRDRRHNHRDEGRKRNSTGRCDSVQELTPVEQQNVSFESWPTLGEAATAGSEEKVPVDGEKDTFKKKGNQDKTVDKSASGQTMDSVDEAVPDESGKSKKMSDSEHTGRDEASSVDEESKGSFIAEHTDSSSVKPDTVDQDGPTQEAPKHSAEDDGAFPEMIKASESGSHISRTVPTPESEPLVRGSAFSAEAVFEHWTRAKRHAFLQKSKDPIFPEAIERLVELKPANLTFCVVHDESRPASLHMQSPSSTGSQSPIDGEYLADKQYTAANLLLGNTSSAHTAFATSSFDGELSPQLMPPMTTTAMSGRHNFPLLVYQVPYNSRAPFIPGTAAYGVSTDSQPGMFIPTSPVQQPLQQHHHQQQPVMGVYLLPPQQMLPPWSGMPVNINNQRRRH